MVKATNGMPIQTTMIVATMKNDIGSASHECPGLDNAQLTRPYWVSKIHCHTTVAESGGIAQENILATYVSGPYADRAELMNKVLGAAEGSASSPDVVADAIAKAVTARRPKTRYAIGAGAKPAVLMARFLPDRAKDRFIVMFYKAAGRRTPAPANSTGSPRVVGTPR